jgi:hypothetical protein
MALKLHSGGCFISQSPYIRQALCPGILAPGHLSKLSPPLQHLLVPLINTAKMDFYEYMLTAIVLLSSLWQRKEKKTF